MWLHISLGGRIFTYVLIYNGFSVILSLGYVAYGIHVDKGTN